MTTTSSQAVSSGDDDHDDDRDDAVVAGRDPAGRDGDTPDDRTPTADTFRTVMSRFVTGVTVMTAVGPDGEPSGMTANAVTSVSLDPMLVLVCVERDTDMAKRVTAGGYFALSLLGAHASEVSDRFADPLRSRGWAAFGDFEVHAAATGAPILADAIAWLDCTVAAVHDGGDHLIVVGAVQAADVHGDRDALGYFHSSYVTVARPDPRPESQSRAN